MTDTTRILLVAPTGRGKTVAGKRIVSTAYDDGWTPIHFSDVKNDFQSISYAGGASKQMIETMGLVEGEEPHAIPRKLFQPKFLVEDYQNGKPSYIEQFTLGFEDITKSDLMFLLDFNSEPQKQVFDNLLGDLNIEDENFTSLKAKLDNVEIDYADNLKGPIKRTLNSLENSKILASHLRKNPFNYIECWECHDCGEYVWKEDKGEHELKNHELEEKRAVVSLSLKHYDNYTYGDEEKFQFYVAVLMRNFIKEVRRGNIEGPFILYGDEFHEVAGRDTGDLVKRYFQKILDIAGRQADVATILSTQRPSKLPYPQSSDPYDFVGDTTHMFIGEGLNPVDWRKALNSTNLYGQGDKEKWRKKINDLNQYEFLYVNPEKHDGVEDCPVVQFYSPLVRHTG
ncbi:hypothetical protein [Haloarcula litorea]|uniref:hypothetical protein n=1 Tax=Haloarcula litorea TaxID=3032579 RepID=UPI0023E75D5E|nr:hypothetical protein [Halomicroarcula sp. GDY20]